MNDHNERHRANYIMRQFVDAIPSLFDGKNPFKKEIPTQTLGATLALDRGAWGKSYDMDKWRHHQIAMSIVHANFAARILIHPVVQLVEIDNLDDFAEWVFSCLPDRSRILVNHAGLYDVEAMRDGAPQTFEALQKLKVR